MRRKINVQLISISIIAIISTMLVMLFVFYDLFQTQVQDDLSANAIVLKNTGIFHSGNEKAIHMDYRELRVTWISSDGTVRDSPSNSVSHTRSMIFSLVRTIPALCIRSFKSSYSL